MNTVMHPTVNTADDAAAERAPAASDSVGGAGAAAAPGLPCGQTAELMIPALVAEVYESASAADRGRLLAQLMRPLGLLSLSGIAGGVFAAARLRGDWRTLPLRLAELRGVGAAQVAALADHAQQVSVETVDGLAALLLASPLGSASAAAALLVMVLVQRESARLARAGTAARGLQPDEPPAR
jgi:hypothetical protein